MPDEKQQKLQLNQNIKYMEELSLNAWPSYKIELYDGWLIRYSCNYTYRTNSVEQIGPSSIPVEEKIAYCEAVYTGFGTPTSFKINPLLDPSFDHLLARRGYDVKHVTEVMTCSLDEVNLMQEQERDYLFENRLNLPTLVRYPGQLTVQLSSEITPEWLQGLFHLNGTASPALRRIVPSMYAAIPKETIAASVEIDLSVAAEAKKSLALPLHTAMQLCLRTEALRKKYSVRFRKYLCESDSPITMRLICSKLICLPRLFSSSAMATAGELAATVQRVYSIEPEESLAPLTGMAS